MKEAVSLVLGLLLACAAGEPSSPATRRSVEPWKQQPRVQAHSGLTVVNPPQLSPTPRFSRRGGSLPGYLPLRPVPNQRNPRWYGAETAPKPSYLRAPPNYERFPPFWSDNGANRPRNRRPSPYRHAKKDCNPCNSVPWTPIFKSPAGLSGNRHPHELVPHIEVYPESTIQQATIISPQVPILDLSPPPTLLEHSHQLVSLPSGNSPVSPELLLPPQQPISFPELSPHPVAPIHQNLPFHPDPHGLVPPKESSNVVVTISEPEPPRDVHLVAHDQHSESSSFVDTHAAQHHQSFRQNGGFDIVKSVPLAEYTSSIEHPFHYIQSSPYIDINTQPNYNDQQHQGPQSNSNTPNTQPNYNGQPHQDPQPNSNPPNTAEFHYEKPSKTGSQKVSDYILNVNKNEGSKKSPVLDSFPAGSNKVSAETTSIDEIAAHQTSGSVKEKTTRLEESYRGVLDPNILTPPPLPPQLTQLLPTFETAYLHPLFPVEHQGVASVVNGALLPPPAPQPMNPTTLQPSNPTVPPKKIQIIIPYTTVNNQLYDQNALGSVLHTVNQSKEPEKAQKSLPIVVNEAPQNQPRKVPENQQNFYNFKNENWIGGQLSESSQVQHILASNIRDLLKKEMEPKQNIRLQKNIDNWTALEYSNHKVVGKKQPGDVITHAQAVTSIPGTSISHLLLPSKKIPDGYFTTTIGPDFDDPATTTFPGTSVSVNSQPFSTVSRYSSVAWTGPTPRTLRNTRQRLLTTPLPEGDNEIPEETTPGPRWSDLKVSIAPGTNEKVYVVTPVSSWTTGKRSTRHIDTTEKYKPEESRNSLFTKLEKVTSHNETDILREKSKNKQKPLYPKSTPLFRVKANQTRYDKISKFNKPKPIAKFFATTSKPLNVEKTSVETTTVTSTAGTTENVLTSTPGATFPFRNGGELPLEMAQSSFSASELTFKNTGERKTLIKQVKTTNRRGKGNKPTTTTTHSLGTTSVERTVTTTERLPAGMEVDVVFPLKLNGSKKDNFKKPTMYGKKKTTEKPIEKTEEKTSINPDKPNITEDDREEINSLMKERGEAEKDENDKETLLAVETAVSPSMPGGVFGKTRPDNSSSRSLLDTIKLLRDFLAETSEEQSQEKTQQIGKVIEKIDAKENSKILNKEVYKYNFPEFLVGELNLNKDEMGLVEDAMVELRKNKERKKVEPSAIDG